jgi:acid phosphatase
MVIMLENKSINQIIGCTCAPYINSLAKQYSYATESFAVHHNSLPNYLATISGTTWGCSSSHCGPFPGPDLPSQLAALGISWRAYIEDMPAPCSLFIGKGFYVRRHNPFVYLSDILDNNCTNTVIPYTLTQLQTDLNSTHPPAFTWITPDNQDNMHSASIQTGDTWLANNLPTVLTSRWFQQNGTVIITFDEGEATDWAGINGVKGGGHILTLFISKHTMNRGTYDTPFDEYAILRALQEAYKVPLLGGAQDPTNGDITDALHLHPLPPAGAES